MSAETAGKDQEGAKGSALPAGLAALIAEAGQTARPRPVERWNPPFCGSIDMRIVRDGTWFYGGSPIGREALVRLFASILRREPDGSFVLVTPVEKVGIEVEDAPFLAVGMSVDGSPETRTLTFRTNVGDLVAAGAGNPLRFSVEQGTGGLKGYLLVRGGLEALVTRALMFDLLNLAGDNQGGEGVWSSGTFFPFPSSADA